MLPVIIIVIIIVAIILIYRKKHPRKPRQKRQLPPRGGGVNSPIPPKHITPAGKVPGDTAQPPAEEVNTK